MTDPSTRYANEIIELRGELSKVSALMSIHSDRADSAEKRVSVLSKELAWYGEQARLARLIHSEGDKGRHAIAADGGKRANNALYESSKDPS